MGLIDQVFWPEVGKDINVRESDYRAQLHNQKLAAETNNDAEREKALHGFKAVAEAAYKQKPLDSKEYAESVAESIKIELQTIAGLSKEESAEIGGHIAAGVQKVTADADNHVNAGDKDAFNKVRTSVSVIIGREVLPKLFEKYNMSLETKDSFEPRDLVYLVGRALQGEVPESALRACASLTPKQMQDRLEQAGIVKEGDYLYGDFAAMKSTSSKLWDSTRQKILDAAILTMNAAWKSIQLGRAVADNDPSHIEYTGTNNYGTFEEMVRAMYRRGLEGGRGNQELGILRAVFELAKDLREIHRV